MTNSLKSRCFIKIKGINNEINYKTVTRYHLGNRTRPGSSGNSIRPPAGDPALVRVMKSLSAVLALLALMVFWGDAAFVWAEIETDIQYKYYSVEITTADKVVSEMFLATPISIDGKRFLGRARWNIKYNIKWAVHFEMCEIVEVLIVNPCLITLPEIQTEDPVLKHLLDNYFKFLKTHELIHCRIATEHAAKLEEKLWEIGRVKCEDVKNLARVEHQSVIAECKSAQGRFDRASNHGHNDGIDLGHLLAPFLASTQKPAAENLKLENLNETADFGEFYQDADGVWRNH